MNNIKFGYYAVYQGKEYEAAKNIEKQIILFSNDIMDLKRGFQKKEKHLIKIVEKSDLDAAYSVKTYAIYKGVECAIEGERNGEYCLHYSYDYEVAEALGFTMLEPAVYEKYVRPEEIDEIGEIKKPIWGFDLPESEQRQRIF